jgi:hypothetical protein
MHLPTAHLNALDHEHGLYADEADGYGPLAAEAYVAEWVV